MLQQSVQRGLINAIRLVESASADNRRKMFCKCEERKRASSLASTVISTKSPLGSEALRLVMLAGKQA